MCLTKMNPNKILQLLKNCASVKLIFLKAMKKATMEDREMTSTAMGDKVIACNYFQLCQGNFAYKEIWNPSNKDEPDCQWHHANIDEQYPVFITEEYLPTNRAKDELCFLERCSLFC